MQHCLGKYGLTLLDPATTTTIKVGACTDAPPCTNRGVVHAAPPQTAHLVSGGADAEAQGLDAGAVHHGTLVLLKVPGLSVVAVGVLE
eukprot:756192-Pyramimonas_sp.AAC.1